MTDEKINVAKPISRKQAKELGKNAEDYTGPIEIQTPSGAWLQTNIPDTTKKNEVFDYGNGIKLETNPAPYNGPWEKVEVVTPVMVNETIDLGRVSAEKVKKTEKAKAGSVEADTFATRA